MYTLNQLKSYSNRFLKRYGKNFKHGYVKFYQGDAYSWSIALEPGRDVAGVVAYGLADGQVYIASGGDYTNGCESWQTYQIN